MKRARRLIEGWVDRAGICTDCGRVLSDPQETFFGTMCHTCKNILIATIALEKRDA